METYFLNYSPISGYSVTTHQNGFINNTITDFMSDVFIGVPSNIGLDEAKQGLISVNLYERFPWKKREIIDEIVVAIREAIDAH